MITPGLDVRYSAERYRTNVAWLDSRHSFAASEHHDTWNTRHGLLTANNDVAVAPGYGFPNHPHQDLEIVTWVTAGILEHRDTADTSEHLLPGSLHRITSGTGYWHAEVNGSTTDELRFVQMWVLPDHLGVTPSTQTEDLSRSFNSGWVCAASGRVPHAAVRIQQRRATLWIARLQQDESVSVPDNVYTHVFVSSGNLAMEGVGFLEAGDAVRLTAIGGHRLTGGIGGAEVLAWEMG